jgi:hypothetical protein
LEGPFHGKVWPLTSGLEGAQTRVDARHRAATLLSVLGELGPEAVKRGTQLRRLGRHIPKATVQGGLGDRLGGVDWAHGIEEAFECSYNARRVRSVYTFLKKIFKKLHREPKAKRILND